MENAHGVINGNHINSREIVFNESNELLTADHFVINNAGVISIKRRYKIAVPKKSAT